MKRVTRKLCEMSMKVRGYYVIYYQTMYGKTANIQAGSDNFPFFGTVKILSLHLLTSVHLW